MGLLFELYKKIKSKENREKMKAIEAMYRKEGVNDTYGQYGYKIVFRDGKVKEEEKNHGK